MAQRSARSAEAVKAIFQRADVNGSGLIERSALIRVISLIAGDPGFDATALLDEVCPGVERVPYATFLEQIFGAHFPGLAGGDPEDLQAAFALLDHNGDGQLDKGEIIEAVRRANDPGDELAELCRQLPGLKPLLDLDSWERAFVAMDTNRDGFIAWFEFLHFFSRSPLLDGGDGGSQQPTLLCKDVPEEDLLAVFSCIDIDHGGTLGKDEVLAAVRGRDQSLLDYCRQVPVLEPLLDPENWETAFRQLDTNEDGQVSWCEFSKFFSSKANWSGELPGHSSAAGA